jgi:hypothetical protein
MPIAVTKESHKTDTHIIASKNLPARGIVHDQLLHPQNLQKRLLVFLGKVLRLNGVDIVLTDLCFVNGVKLVEDRDPVMHVPSRILPWRVVRQKLLEQLMQLFIFTILDLVDETSKIGVLCNGRKDVT